MKAITQDKYGTAEVLKFSDIDQPTVGDHDVLVDVQAASVCQGVWHLMAGRPYMIRAMGFGFSGPKNSVLGMDVAGKVAAVGAKVTTLKPGDEVFGTCEGSFAEYVCVPADRVALKPTNLTFEQAAAVPTSGFSALKAVRDVAKIQTGQKVLITGASGGVGTFAVQMAKAHGAVVTGVCSTAKEDLVRSLGADEVIDYTRENFADGNHHYDVILDIAGNTELSALRRVLTPKGTLVLVGGEEGGAWFGGIGRNVRAVMLSPFIGQNLLGMVADAPKEDLQALRELLEAGKITPAISCTFPLNEVPSAIKLLKKGHAGGKIVIAVS